MKNDQGLYRDKRTYQYEYEPLHVHSVVRHRPFVGGFDAFGQGPILRLDGGSEGL